MTTRIKLRRDTAANWTSNDPVLALGEAGYDTTNNELRVGDGTSAWSALSAIGGTGNKITALKTYSDNHNDGSNQTFTYTTGSIAVQMGNDNGLYLNDLLSRLSAYFDGDTTFPYNYSNVSLVINPNTTNLSTTVTNVISDNNNPPLYTITLTTTDPGPIVVDDIDFNYTYINTIGLDTVNDYFGMSTGDDDIDILSGRDINLNAADDFYVSAGNQFDLRLVNLDDMNSSQGINIITETTASTKTWTFRFDGNLDVPGVIIGAAFGLNLASSQGSVDIGRYLRVRDGDIESHIHIDSPDNNTYDLIFGDDSKYLRVDHTGTVVIGNNNDTNTWTFAVDGSLTIPGPIHTTGTLVVDTLKIGFGGGFMFYNTNTNEVTHNPYVPLGMMQGPMQTLNNVTTGTNTFDCETGHIFYVTAPEGDWTVNFINANNFLPNQVIAMSIIIEQGATAYLPTAVQVEGNSTTLTWLNNTPPTGNANKTDIVAYRIICTATNTYRVLATFQTY